MLDRGVGAVTVDQPQHLVSLAALEEHDVHPPRHRGLRLNRVHGGGVPGDASGSLRGGVQPLLGQAEHAGGSAQLDRGLAGVTNAGGLVAVIVEGPAVGLGMDAGELVEDLLEPAGRGKQVADHPVSVFGVGEVAAGVGQAA
ncbi:hypothetical protein EB836_10510 [Brevibacterium sp. S111]|nr:hypothetical protein EB836_10510 [Brevibacterium sp. S111]